MKNVSYVDNMIIDLKGQGVPLSDIAWKAALACVGWPYVYGAVGEECKPAKRAQYGTKFYPKDHETIVTKCQAISWDSEKKSCKVTGNCTGCKWNLPVRMFDCRGFTRKILQMVYGWTLMGGTVGGQWNDERNWKEKGTIDTMPRNTLCCLFVFKNNKWQHTGFGFNDETIEASSGVQHFTKRNTKWTHWAIPACIDGAEVPTEVVVKPSTDTTVKLPTLRKGNKGSYVSLLQTLLLNRGYKLPKYGADGDFGNETFAAVKQFQQDWGLKVDGIVGPETWQYLETSPVKQKTYTVTIPNLTEEMADELLSKYVGTKILDN